MICYNLLKVLKFPTHVLIKRYPWVRECPSCFHYIPLIILESKFDYNRMDLIIPPPPAPPKVEWGYTGFTPMSVCPSVWRILGFRNFLKRLLAPYTSFLAFTLMGWVSWPIYIFVFLASFSALWWPNIWLKMGFPELVEKTIGSIHFIPGIYPYGVSFLPHFRVPSLIFGLLVAKYLAENGVSGTFWKNY